MAEETPREALVRMTERLRPYVERYGNIGGPGLKELFAACDAMIESYDAVLACVPANNPAHPLLGKIYELQFECEALRRNNESLQLAAFAHDKAVDGIDTLVKRQAEVIAAVRDAVGCERWHITEDEYLSVQKAAELVERFSTQPS